MKILNKYSVEIFISFFLLVLLIYNSEPILYTDSHRYINQSLHDPPLYSSLINISKSVFESFKSLVLTQTLFIGFSVIYFSRTVSIYFNLDNTIKSIVAIFLIIPVFKLYNLILTEPICYALSLLFISFATKLIYNFKVQNLIILTILIILLILCRNQFAFLYPVVILLYLGIVILKRSKKILINLIFSLFSIILISNLIIGLNKNIIKKHSINNVHTYNEGIYFFTYIDAIYISSQEDAKIFQDFDKQTVVAKILKHIDTNEASMKHYNNRGHYSSSLKEIRLYSENLLINLATKKNTSIKNLKKEISIKLIKLNYKKYIKHIFKKSYDSTWLFIFVPLLIMLASFISFIKYKLKYSLIILFVSIFAITNHSIIYLFGRVQPRYFIYTDFVLLVFVFISFVIFLKKENVLLE
jgi:hypothetical protein